MKEIILITLTDMVKEIAGDECELLG